MKNECNGSNVCSNLYKTHRKTINNLSGSPVFIQHPSFSPVHCTGPFLRPSEANRTEEKFKRDRLCSSGSSLMYCGGYSVGDSINLLYIVLKNP